MEKNAEALIERLMQVFEEVCKEAALEEDFTVEQLTWILRQEPVLRKRFRSTLRLLSDAPTYAGMYSIMAGRLVVLPGYINKRLDTHYSEEELAWYSVNQPTRAILEWCRVNDCVIVAAPPKEITLRDLLRLDSRKRLTISEGLCNQHAFANEKTSAMCWLLLRTSALPGTSKCDAESARVQIPEIVEIPNAADLYWCIRAIYQKHKIRLFEKSYMSTSSRTDSCIIVTLGSFYEDGLRFNFWDGRADAAIAPAIIRKYPA